MFRILVRGLLVVIFAIAALTFVSFALYPAQAKARHQAATITCVGSIQACIDAASDGDTIVIPAGTYTESLTLSKPVSLTGVNSATTIIHALANQRVLTVTGATISNSVVISGLTFTGGDIRGMSGYCPESCGGGILLQNAAQPLIQNVIIADNHADSGGGVHAETPLTLSSVIFFNNSASGAGGGMYANGALTLSNTEFVSNATNSSGGGVLNAGGLTCLDCRFVGNSATYLGGGASIYVYDNGGTSSIVNTDFVSNSAGWGGRWNPSRR